jgi:hypothetical protein
VHSAAATVQAGCQAAIAVAATLFPIFTRSFHRRSRYRQVFLCFSIFIILFNYLFALI